MIETVDAMGRAGDDSALDDLWQLLGGSPGASAERPPGLGAEAWRQQRVGLIVALVHDLCGARQELYAAERQALGELAATAGVDSRRHPDVAGLEHATLDALAARLQERLGAMSEPEQRRFFEAAVKRMSDEQRIQLMDQVLQGYRSMSDSEQQQFLTRLAGELDLGESELRAAATGGSATLLRLLMARGAGFTTFAWTAELMTAVAAPTGLPAPIAAYLFGNRALGWLLGPVGMLVTTAMSAAWFGARSWRRKQRFRKLVQVVAYTSAWRAEQAA